MTRVKGYDDHRVVALNNPTNRANGTTIFNYGVPFWFGFLIPTVSAIYYVWRTPLLGVSPFLGLILFAVISLDKSTIGRVGLWLFPTMLLSLYLLLNVLQSNAPEYGLWKSGYFMFYFVGGGFAILSSLRNQDSIIEVCSGLALGSLFSLIVDLVTIGNPLTRFASWGKFDRLALGDANPIVWAQFLGAGIILFSWFALHARKVLYLYVDIVLAGLSLVYMVMSGSKGPLVGLGLSIIVFLFVAFPKRIVLPIMVLLVITGSSLVLSDSFASITSNQFLMYRFGLSQSSSVDDRTRLIELGIDRYTHLDAWGKVFGEGTGNYASLCSDKDESMFPHNGFVEILYEGGIVGLILYSAMIFAPGYAIFRAVRNVRFRSIDREGVALFSVTLSLYVYSVLVAQFSGDVSSNWFLSVFGSVLLAFSFSLFARPHVKRPSQNPM